MTDNTQPEAGSTYIIRYALELGLLWIDGDGRDKVREALDALDTLEAQLEAIGAGQDACFQPADMATAAAQGFRDGVASLAASAREPVAIRPDIQAVLAMLDVPVIARMSSHEGKLLKPGQEPPAFESAVPLVREWDHRRACETIIAALSGNN